ncbi:unnamed protein product, partial [Ectocarpus sp. 12 AP-2014]
LAFVGKGAIPIRLSYRGSSPWSRIFARCRPCRRLSPMLLCCFLEKVENVYRTGENADDPTLSSWLLAVPPTFLWLPTTAVARPLTRVQHLALEIRARCVGAVPQARRSTPARAWHTAAVSCCHMIPRTTFLLYIFQTFSANDPESRNPSGLPTPLH